MSELKMIATLCPEVRYSRRDRILREAAKLFNKKGYSKTTARDIGTAVGILNGSIFYYFPTKAHILAAVITDAMSRGEQVVQQALADSPPDPRDRFEALLRTHLTLLFSEESRYAHQVANREWKHVPAELLGPLRQLNQSYRQVWWQIMDELDEIGLLRIPRSTLFRFCVGGLNWTSRCDVDRSPEVVSGLAKQIRKLVLCES
jgi:AcrR family transcriptional regulator